MKKKIFDSISVIRFTILVLLFPVLYVYAQGDSDKLLNSLQNKFESINDLTLDIVQKSGGQEFLSGKLSFKKENKFYLGLKNNLIVSDGSSIWNYNKRENKVIINSVDESAPTFFSFNTFVYDYPSKCNITSEQNGEVLVFTPKPGSDLNFNKAKLWVSKENLLSKIVLEGSPSGEIEVVFSNYKLNQNLKNSIFTFIPPEGSTVIDLR